MPKPETSTDGPTSMSYDDQPPPPTPDSDWFWVPAQRKWLRWNEMQEIVHEEIAENSIEKMNRQYGGSDLVNDSQDGQLIEQ